MERGVSKFCACKASDIDRVTSVAFAVVTASTLLPTRAFSVHTVSAAFVVAGLAGSAGAV